ncbi:helix-turn-helix domain-containing protein [Streptomyces sp. NPDC057743]|uniref:helix-turn-helix domain-containing protein n=1 Tax=Streptomyces sp. NPDC057743 TaxID=3346236 RepID=UPI0036769105
MPKTPRLAAPSGTEDRVPLATPEDVAAYLGVPVKTLYQWRHRRIGPNALKVGRHLRYRWAEVDAWLTAQSAYDLTA